MNINHDTFIYMLKFITSYDDLSNICNSNKNFRNSCKHNNRLISKYLLHLYKVDYTDPLNYIYVHNNEKLDDYKLSNSFDYLKLWKLYFRDFYKSDIVCDNEGITSFPIYPNMISFFGEGNKLTTFPVQPNMIEVWVNNNDLSDFPSQPNMTRFYGEFNKITDFSVQPNLEYCDVSNNQLESFPIQPKLEYFIGSNNILETFPIQPKMNHFIGSFNNLESFPIQPKMTRFTAENNNLSDFSIQPKLRYFKALNNPRLSRSNMLFDKQPVLRHIVL